MTRFWLHWRIALLALVFGVGCVTGFLANLGLLRATAHDYATASDEADACEDARQEEADLCREEVRRLVQVKP